MEMQAGKFLFAFPEKVWEIIFGKLDRMDVLNLLKAFPKLDEAFRSKKHLWLLEEILPQVFQFQRLLTVKGILNCRLVCKRWCEDADNFLQNQINLPPSRVQKDTFGVVYRHQFSPAPLRTYGYCGQRAEKEKLVWTAPTTLIPVNYKQGVEVYDAVPEEWGNDLVFFIVKMKDCPSESNPFPSRRVVIETYYDELLDGNDEYLEVFWVGMLEIFEKFGKHVWSLNFSFRHAEDEDEYRPMAIVWIGFLKSLLQLPNLRSLHFTGEGGIETTRFNFNSLANKALPPLPDLKEIEISLMCCPLELETLLLQYLPQLEKLTVPGTCWNPGFPKMFPTLQDLTITAIEYTELLSFLLVFRAPCLTRLNLELGERYAFVKDEDKCPTHRLEIVRDVFPILRRFPSLKVFGIDTSQLKHVQLTNRRPPSKQRFPNIEFLKIPDFYCLTYDFLLCFPALRQLHIKVESRPMVLDNSNCLNSVVRIRDQLDTGKLYESNIWQLLPTLEKIGLEIGPGRFYWRPSCHKYFCRETYDYLTKSGGNSPKDLHPLREDIQRELEHNFMYGY